MKKLAFCCILALGMIRTEAQGLFSIVTEAVTKVVRAVDLEVQRIQTQTIALQEAQKTLENNMAATRLGEIHDWVQQQKDLYADYFQELWTVKNVLTAYHKVSETIQLEERIVAGYQQSLNIIRQDPHFSAAELSQITAVFTGILTESANDLERLTRLIQPFTMQMTDQERMELIDRVAADMNRQYKNIQDFTNQSGLLSLQRSNDEKDYLTLKNLYGL